jgi:3-isopropylmalate/(R)-2-methylmalate dehydratase small subunit
MRPGDVWVGGSNLGCSSSRNTPLYMKDKGIGAVVCHSAARIFYRNCVNMGLPIFELGPAAAGIAMGDQVRIDVSAARIENLTRATEFQVEPFPDFIMELLLAGGIARYIAAHKERYALLA